MVKALEVLLPETQEGGKIKAIMDDPTIPPKEDEQKRKQFIMAKAMPVVQLKVGGVMTEYKFPPGPIGLLQAFASLSKWKDSDESKSIEECTQPSSAPLQSSHTCRIPD